ncbi:hypothetical protein SDC9_155073 [bioreactor metagenome]|uniref:Uncharacterized protein n=1 Tax=bioreactor metagenome TaxID=1076179 RepID=A0A645F0J8_9ZZZZ
MIANGRCHTSATLSGSESIDQTRVGKGSSLNPSFFSLSTMRRSNRGRLQRFPTRLLRSTQPSSGVWQLGMSLSSWKRRPNFQRNLDWANLIPLISMKLSSASPRSAQNGTGKRRLIPIAYPPANLYRSWRRRASITAVLFSAVNVLRTPRGWNRNWLSFRTSRKTDTGGRRSGRGWEGRIRISPPAFRLRLCSNRCL